MTKKNILVFPCGSEIGLDIYSSVKFSAHFHLIGASSVDDHGEFVYEDYIGGLPFADDPAFIPALSKIVKEREIDGIYPTMDMVITVIKAHESELGCCVISSPSETARICLSKSLTYKTLQGVVKVPGVFDAFRIPAEDFPVFAKPDVGYSAKGTKILGSQNDVSSFLIGKEDILVLEYLPGDEYTVDCFTDKHGNLLYCGARQRNRIGNGISVNTTFVKNQSEFNDFAQRINSRISFRGSWFYQVKRDQEGKLTLLEVASRLGGSSLLARARGVNFALLSLFDAFEYDVAITQNNYDVILDRALGNRYKTNLQFDSVYCDYDDCLILNKSIINIQLVQFLYKCVNEHKRIYLLSKHFDANLLDELTNFRLYYLFDKIIQIDSHSNKTEYINMADNPIFIDDSYAERQNVSETLHIPVFAPDMIDVLLDS